MKFHNMANIFPMMAGIELKTLAADIKEHGLKEKIVLYDEQILDGRNRYKACELAGVKPGYEHYGGEDPLAHIISLNLHRRHLNESQRAMVAAKLADMPQGMRTDIQPSANLPNVIPQPEAARMLNIGERLLRDAKAVIRDAPGQVEAIESGEKTVTQVKREIQKEKIKSNIPETPSGKFRVFYADPPWSYGDKLVEGYGTAEHHYPCMSIKELCALPITDLTEDNAVLFLWTTSPLLAECFTVIAAWGFKYKSSFIWDKIRHNMGHYNSVRHEFLLICTKGSCLPEIKELHDSVIPVERTKKHSEKPEYFRQLIDKLYPSGKRIELFARKKTKGWSSYGNEL